MNIYSVQTAMFRKENKPVKTRQYDHSPLRVYRGQSYSAHLGCALGFQFVAPIVPI